LLPLTLVTESSHIYFQQFLIVKVLLNAPLAHIWHSGVRKMATVRKRQARYHQPCITRPVWVPNWNM